MNADNIAVTQQEEEEWKLRNKFTDNQNFKVGGKNGEHFGDSKVEPKEGEFWMVEVIGSGIIEGARWRESAYGFFTPISRLYTQEEYDNKPVSAVDDSELNDKTDLIKAQNEIAAILGKYKVALIARSVKGKHDNNKHMQFPVIGFQDYNHCSEYETERSHITGYELYSIIADQLKEDKEAREQAEMIDDACELLFGDSAEQCRDDVRSTVESMIVAGYRK